MGYETICKFDAVSPDGATVHLYREPDAIAPVVILIEGLKPDDFEDSDSLEIELSAEDLRRILRIEDPWRANVKP